VTGKDGISAISSEDQSLLLNATVFPDNATNKSVTWSVENITGEATIDQTGLVKATQNGIVTGKATANDGSGIYGTISIAISSVIVEPAGSETMKIIVSQTELKIMLRNNTVRWKVALYDMQGIQQKTTFMDSDNVTIDVSTLHSGMYMVVLTRNDFIKVSKVFKP
jgi:uncharacterized protein YjdB